MSMISKSVGLMGWAIAGAILGSGLMTVPSGMAQTSPIANYQAAAYQTISRDTATQSSVQLQVAPGRVTTLQFQSDEIISYVLIADPSRIVYSSSGELGSPQAKSLFLRRIEPLDFPGATTTWVTNLTVQTIDPSGQQRLYNFDITLISDSPRFVGVIVLPAVAGQQTLSLDRGRTATLRDIEEGLQIAIRKGYTPESDPIVSGVRQMLAIARTENMTLVAAATTANVSLSIVTELAEIAFEQRLRPTNPVALPAFNELPPAASDVVQRATPDSEGNIEVSN